MKIVIASPEMKPFSGTSIISEITNALSENLVNKGHDVFVITPKYKTVDTNKFKLKRNRQRLGISIRGKHVQGSLFEHQTPTGVNLIFVDQSTYFDRPGLYAAEDNQDYPDNDERFAFFSHAVLETCCMCNIVPDIIHCHDWQTGPVPALLQFVYRDRAELNSTGTVFSIHNLDHQGLFSPDSMMSLGLDWSLFTPSSLESSGKVSFLKAGLAFADKLTISGKSQKEELKNSLCGFGMDNILQERASDLNGIMNGIDYSGWDPSKDPNISLNYSADDLSGKSSCKAHVQELFGFEQNRNIPLISWIGTFSTRSGIDLFLQAGDQLLQNNCQWLFMGDGDNHRIESLKQLAAKNPGKMSIKVGSDDECFHQIIAGADILLALSRFDPNDMTLLCALRYGTIPLALDVGNTLDIVDDESEEFGTGFLFAKPVYQDLSDATAKALDRFSDKNLWHNIMTNAMDQVFSWDLPARRFEATYRQVIALRNQ
jgi:starch synthase